MCNATACIVSDCLHPTGEHSGYPSKLQLVYPPPKWQCNEWNDKRNTRAAVKTSSVSNTTVYMLVQMSDYDRPMQVFLKTSKSFVTCKHSPCRLNHNIWGKLHILSLKSNLESCSPNLTKVQLGNTKLTRNWKKENHGPREFRCGLRSAKWFLCVCSYVHWMLH